MLKMMFRTEPAFTLLILRLGLGVVMFGHGAQKMLGMFGGPGFSAAMKGLTEHAGIPGFFAFLVIIGEFFGALGLIFGFLTRLSAAGIGIIMVGAVLFVHADEGFFMNWRNVPERGHGFEYHILAIVIAVALLFKGAGLFSVDRYLAARKKKPD
ncbi:MAG: DoxX family protein [Planctomycetota bacterium]|nr:DoxX family protein [Planctomycetota bacterium]